MALKTYTNQKYGFSKPYRDNLNKMNKTIKQNSDIQQNKINQLYNNEISRLNKVKQSFVDTGESISKEALSQPQQYTDRNSVYNQLTDNRVFKGLNNKLSETSNIGLMNTARAMSDQALGTTSTILRSIDQDMATAKANRDINLAQSTKQKFDLMYDNFYQINEAYLSNRELLQELEEE